MLDLEIKELSFSLRGKRILEDISLAVKHGEFVGIIGPNGSGKSTLLKHVYRVLQPERGEIILLGQQLADMTLGESARQMAVVGQFHTVAFDFSVYDMVMMGRIPQQRHGSRISPQDRAAVEQALQLVGLQDMAQRRFHSLSGGEQQRVVMARALAQEPRFLLLDEPTNHLDIRYQIQLMEMAAGLGIGVLAVLHDLNLAAMYCKRLYVLKKGRIMSAGEPETVLTPALVRKVYGVPCEVIRRQSDRPVIVFEREAVGV